MDISLGGMRDWVTRFIYDARYIMALQILVLLAAIVFYFVVSIPSGVIVATVGLLLIQGFFHTKWLYEDLRASDTYEHHPLASAIVGVLGMYALGVTAAIVIFVVIGVLTLASGMQLYLPAVILMIIGFFVYTYVKM